MPQPFTSLALRAVASQPQTEILPMSALLPNGGHAVVWNVDTGNSPISAYLQIYDSAGNAIGGPVQILTSVASGSGVMVTGVGALADGTIVVAGSTTSSNAGASVWSVYSARLNASGQQLSTSQVGTWTSDTATRVTGGDIYVAPDGSYYVAASVQAISVGQPSYMTSVQHYDAAGSKIGAVFTAGSEFNHFASDAILANGNILTGQTNFPSGATDQVFINVIDSSGNTVSHQVVTYADTHAVDPVTAAIGSGNGIAIWREFPLNSGAASMHAQIVDGSGNLVGASFAISLPAVPGIHLTSLTDGGVLAWWSEANSVSAVYIDSNGQVAGTPFSIGSGVTDVTATANGGFIVASANGDIHEQAFLPLASGGVVEVHAGLNTAPAGSHNFTGTAGLDMLAFAGPHTDYTVASGTVTSAAGTSTISGVERILFNDHFGVALDVGGDAGQAYRLYQAAFDRQPDLPGLGFQMNQLDQGRTLASVAQDFLNSPEFQTKYGNVDDATYIGLLYQHVLHRTAAQDEIDFHVNQELHNGYSRAQVLTFFSESPENQANVIGDIGHGMLFVPVG
jgi:hypothetical protein